MDPFTRLFSMAGMLDAKIIKARDAAIANKSPQMVFDWNRAVELIKRYIEDGEDFIAIAGLTGDMGGTSGQIFRLVDGKEEVVLKDYTYLSSCHAEPCLVIRDLNGNEKGEFPCWIPEEGSGYGADTKWPKDALEKLLPQKSPKNPRFRMLDTSEDSEPTPPKRPKTNRFKNLG